MAPTVIGKKMYGQELIVRAFQYFVTSRGLYNQLRLDYQLPSTKTLTRITSRVSNLNVKWITMCNNARRNLFGRVTDDPQSFAKFVVGVMISCMFRRSVFISKILPIAKLNSPFLYEKIRLTFDVINQSSSEVKALSCDGSRNGQAFSRLFDTESQRPQ